MEIHRKCPSKRKDWQEELPPLPACEFSLKKEGQDAQEVFMERIRLRIRRLELYLIY